MIAAVALFVLALALRGATKNRHVRSRLTASAVSAVLYALLSAGVRFGGPSEDMRRQFLTLLPLLAAFGFINALVPLIINPWRHDRHPDRFPTIVQDSIVIGLFALAATMVLQEKIFAATAVGAVVLGLALQDTLGNLFAGLAIQTEKPFSVGHWVRIADIDGLVKEVTWRATKVCTKSGNFVVVPNSKLAHDIIINYSEPTRETRLELEVGVSYDAAPNDVKQTIRDALRDDPRIQGVRPPEMLLVGFNDSSITYRIWVWVTEFATDEYVKDDIRTAIYYAFKRRGIVIPFPIRTTILVRPTPLPERDFEQEELALRGVTVFSELGAPELAALTRATVRSVHGAGETIVRAGDPGASMFIVGTGEAAVFLEADDREVARIKPGGFFGEMSLLTGAPRSATVRTTTDSELIELTADVFRRFVLANPKVVAQVGAAVTRRQAELDERRAENAAGSETETSESLIGRIKHFLGLDDAD